MPARPKSQDRAVDPDKTGHRSFPCSRAQWMGLQGRCFRVFACAFESVLRPFDRQGFTMTLIASRSFIAR